MRRRSPAVPFGEPGERAYAYWTPSQTDQFIHPMLGGGGWCHGSNGVRTLSSSECSTSHTHICTNAVRNKRRRMTTSLICHGTPHTHTLAFQYICHWMSLASVGDVECDATQSESNLLCMSKCWGRPSQSMCNCCVFVATIHDKPPRTGCFATGRHSCVCGHNTCPSAFCQQYLMSPVQMGWVLQFIVMTK